MADLLTKPLPTCWAGRRIDPDFRNMVWLANAYARGVPDKDPLIFADDACLRFYLDGIVGVQHLPDAYKALLDFYRCGEDTEPDDGGEGGSGVLPFDYQCDAPYIIAAFQQLYGIDLTTEKVHWWRFRSLLRSALAEDVLFSRIVRWRTADTSQMTPEERQHTEEMRQRFALPEELRGGAAVAQSLEDHNAAFLARFKR